MCHILSSLACPETPGGVKVLPTSSSCKEEVRHGVPQAPFMALREGRLEWAARIGGESVECEIRAPSLGTPFS